FNPIPVRAGASAAPGSRLRSFGRYLSHMSGREENSDGPRRERRFGGVRLVGIFVPWQAVALTLGLVVALTGLAVGRWTAGGETRVHLSAADETTSTTAMVESIPSTTLAPTTTT